MTPLLQFFRTVRSAVSPLFNVNLSLFATIRPCFHKVSPASRMNVRPNRNLSSFSGLIDIGKAYLTCPACATFQLLIRRLLRRSPNITIYSRAHSSHSTTHPNSHSPCGVWHHCIDPYLLHSFPQGRTSRGVLCLDSVNSDE